MAPFSSLAMRKKWSQNGATLEGGAGFSLLTSKAPTKSINFYGP